MTQFVHRLPMWVYQAWMGVSIAVVLGTVVVSAWAGMALHRENDTLADEVQQSREAIDQLATVSKAQDTVLDKANRKLRRLGENPIRSPFPFTFVFKIGGVTFTVTCAEPGEQCLVQS